MPDIRIPRDALVVLCGLAGSGKSHFAGRYFVPSQVVSSDECRRMIADDPADQACSGDAFKLLYHIVDKRLKFGRLTVADSTAISHDVRVDLLKLARKHRRPAVLVVFQVPEGVCLERDQQRDRKVGWEVIQDQAQRFRRAMEGVNREGFDAVYWVSSEDQNDIVVEVEEQAQHQFRDVRGVSERQAARSAGS